MHIYIYLHVCVLPTAGYLGKARNAELALVNRPRIMWVLAAAYSISGHCWEELEQCVFALGS